MPCSKLYGFTNSVDSVPYAKRRDLQDAAETLQCRGDFVSVQAVVGRSSASKRVFIIDGSIVATGGLNSQGLVLPDPYSEKGSDCSNQKLEQQQQQQQLQHQSWQPGA